LELVDCDAPLAKTKSFYRFLIEVKPNALTKFQVQERKDLLETEEVFNWSSYTLNENHRNKYITDIAFQSLTTVVIPLRDKISTFSTELSVLGPKIRTKQDEIDKIVNLLQQNKDVALVLTAGLTQNMLTVCIFYLLLLFAVCLFFFFNNATKWGTCKLVLKL